MYSGSRSLVCNKLLGNLQGNINEKSVYLRGLVHGFVGVEARLVVHMAALHLVLVHLLFRHYHLVQEGEMA